MRFQSHVQMILVIRVQDILTLQFLDHTCTLYQCSLNLAKSPVHLRLSLVCHVLIVQFECFAVSFSTNMCEGRVYH